MTPYLQLRLWWRRASSGDRLAASLALALVIALAAWGLTPTNSGKRSTSLRAGATGATDVAGEANGGGGAAAGAATGSGPAVGGTGASAGAAGSGTASRAGGQAPSGGLANARNAATGAPCPATPKGAAGVTDKSISLDVAVLDLAGPIGNNAAGQASADDLTKFGQTVLADINARGGLACRPATAKFYKVNPIGADQGRNA